jgi:excisionase family DNA binding protein
MPLLLDAAEAAIAMSLSRSKVLSMAVRGEIPSLQIGRSLRIPRDALLEWIDQRVSAGSNRTAVRVPAWAHVDRSAEL